MFWKLKKGKMNGLYTQVKCSVRAQVYFIMAEVAAFHNEKKRKIASISRMKPFFMLCWHTWALLLLLFVLISSNLGPSDGIHFHTHRPQTTPAPPHNYTFYFSPNTHLLFTGLNLIISGSPTTILYQTIQKKQLNANDENRWIWMRIRVHRSDLKTINRW